MLPNILCDRMQLKNQAPAVFVHYLHVSHLNADHSRLAEQSASGDPFPGQLM
jgi:hypothetical protein